MARMSPSTPDPTRTDLDARIARLELADKVRLLTGETMFTLPGDDRIELTGMAFSDGPTGVRGLTFTGGDPVALLPNATVLASAWDEDGAHEVGRIVAEEALRQHIHVVLGPTINLHRTALGGRLFEAYSEDPLLTGRIAAAYVRGVQESGIGACLKHLVANEAETLRNSVDNRVDAKTLRELYLLPFQIAVEDADAWTIMDAYNDVNGVAATEQVEVNTEIVKGEWGYTGLIMSDWFATKTTAASANGGLDLVMPGPSGPWGDALVAAVQAGEVAEDVVDDHLRRLLVLADRVGALGTPRDWPDQPEAPDSPRRREQLTRLAAAGFTVLTNDGTLPLAADGDSTVALIGRPAIDTTTMGGGSAQVSPPYSVSIADGLQALLGDRLTVVDGVEVRSRAVAADPAYVTDPSTGDPGVEIVLEDAEGQVIETRHVRTGQTMVGFDDALERPAATVRLRAHVAVDGPAQVGVIGIADWQLTADGQTFTTSMTAGGADPGEGVLSPPSWSTVLELDSTLVEATATLATAESGVSGARMLGLVARPAPREARSVIAEAAATAAATDVAVVVVGLTEEQETEATDKTTLALPGRQDDLVRAVARSAKRTVVVVNAATPVLMPWADEVEAILVVGLPGQEGGHAVAQALLGHLEPAGRLVTSYPSADGASPAWSVTPVHGVLTYAEGGLIGYRGYAAGRATAPAFWFGHGLGYGSWEYGTVALRDGAAGEPPSVDVEITNTSERTSREVVQVYLDPPAGPAGRTDAIRLVGWASATVEPGATETVTVRTDPRVLQRWDAGVGAWVPLTGGRLLVARGLGDVRAHVDLPA